MVGEEVARGENRLSQRVPGETLIERNRRFFLYGEPHEPVGPWIGAVAVLDVLGFRTAGQRANVADEVALLSAYFGFEKAYLERHEKLVRVHFTPKGIKHTRGPRVPKTRVSAFQDTLVITMRGLAPARRTLFEMGRKLYAPFRSALENGIFMRGAISLGRFYQTASTVVGPAVYEALDWHDKADWVGVILTPSAQYGIERLRHDRQSPGYFVPYKVPLKGERTYDTWALAWPRNFMREELLELFSESHILTEDAGKYRNTLAFFDDVAPQQLRNLREDEAARAARERKRVHRLASIIIDKTGAASESPAVIAERRKQAATRKETRKTGESRTPE